MDCTLEPRIFPLPLLPLPAGAKLFRFQLPARYPPQPVTLHLALWSDPT